MQSTRSFPKNVVDTVFTARRAFRDIHRFEGRRGLLTCCLGEFGRGDMGSNETELTIVTFTICPQMARLWHYRAARTFGRLAPNYAIIDSTGILRRPQFHSTRLIPMLNHQHGIKIDRILQRVRSKYVLICDDDIFFIGLAGIEWALKQFEQSENVVAVSLKPRKRFKWTLNANEYTPMGTYCLLLRPDVIRREKLSFVPVHQPSPTPLSYKGEYDTGDFANVELLQRGYAIHALPQHLQEETYVAFHGMSVVILKMRAGYRNPKSIGLDQRWVLYRGLSSHLRLREVYSRQFGEQSNWTMLPGQAEDGFLEYLANALPADQKREIDFEIESSIEMLMNAD